MRCLRCIILNVNSNFMVCQIKLGHLNFSWMLIKQRFKKQERLWIWNTFTECIWMELLAFIRTTGDLSSPLDLALVFGADLGLCWVLWGGRHVLWGALSRRGIRWVQTEGVGSEQRSFWSRRVQSLLWLCDSPCTAKSRTNKWPTHSCLCLNQLSRLCSCAAR